MKRKRKYCPTCKKRVIPFFQIKWVADKLYDVLIVKACPICKTRLS